jgi:phospholipase C
LQNFQQYFQQYFEMRQSRRRVLQTLGALASAGLVLDACGSTETSVTPTPSGPGSIESIKHIVIACQENHSFDTYFGYYPKSGNFGIPAGYSQPDGKGGTVTPHKFLISDTNDIAHDWHTIHREWNNGKMDGFYITDGASALGNAGPPAPPRDGLAQIGDFYEAFDFTQNPNYYPKLST